MTSVLSNRCLVLNKNWSPVGTVGMKRAIIMLFSEKARVIEPTSYQAMTWDDWSKLKLQATDEKIASANMYFKVPEVILLTDYEKVPQPRIRLSRRNLFKRDKLECQYCGVTPGSQELTIDHVIPKSQGGQTVWENCVLSCINCNRKKADKTLNQAGMKLRKKPVKPVANSFHYQTMKPIKSWEAFLGESYWSVELQN